MDAETLRRHCLAKPGSSESLPFGPDTLVFKVLDKAFALLALEAVPPRVNLKCDPDRALDLRAEWPDTVLPGYHMNKRHWNTVVLDGRVPSATVREWIDHSWDRVVAGMSARQRAALSGEDPSPTA